MNLDADAEPLSVPGIDDLEKKRETLERAGVQDNPSLKAINAYRARRLALEKLVRDRPGGDDEAKASKIEIGLRELQETYRTLYALALEGKWQRGANAVLNDYTIAAVTCKNIIAALRPAQRDTEQV